MQVLIIEKILSLGFSLWELPFLKPPPDVRVVCEESGKNSKMESPTRPAVGLLKDQLGELIFYMFCKVASQNEIYCSEIKTSFSLILPSSEIWVGLVVSIKSHQMSEGPLTKSSRSVKNILTWRSLAGGTCVFGPFGLQRYTCDSNLQMRRCSEIISRRCSVEDI